VAGSIFAMWLGEKITDKGIGNGISILIMVGILSRFHLHSSKSLPLRTGNGGLGSIMILIEVYSGCW
jgi:preprotein translocase subunit SecY